MRALILTLTLASTAALATEFVGARQCKGCHEAHYQRWRASPHARASEALSEVQRRDPRCGACHATAPEEGLYGVQCEACHGPGRYTWPSYIKRDRRLAAALGFRRGDEPDLCARCHTSDHARRPLDPQARASICSGAPPR
ncbi:cytochrome c family protein [Myxococcota bacterium]|nr:cytochrome c family protein [Myxococcota bacterium]MBU1430130.1 cytochrome c family protein [Myxococcota bacterium]MBU1896901.1 cytochrome c family protein [Myxococcota bacterium]